MSANRHTSRDAFLGRVRAALGRRGGGDTAAPQPPDVTDAVVRTCSGDARLTDRFAGRAAAVGMDVRRCGTGELADRLVAVLQELSAGQIVCAVESLAQGPRIEQAIDAAGITRRLWRGDRTMGPSYDADAGVSDVAAAIAETGTLVHRGESSRGRGHMLVPPVHVAIVQAGQIVPDLIDHMRRCAKPSPAAQPAGQCLITGPSKTADIEGVLVTGVHGPGRVVVLLVE